MHPIPDITQFQIVCERKEIFKDDMWPPGHIEAVPMKFPVIWETESPQSPDGIFVHKQEDLTPLLTEEAAWSQLSHIVLNLAEDPVINYRGLLKPGLTLKSSGMVVSRLFMKLFLTW
jgi:hypothetical protein